MCRAKALSETSSLNNLCVPVTKTTLVCHRSRVSFIGQCHAYARTHVYALIHIHTHFAHPHEFSIIQIGFPYWVRAGGSRRFSLSIGRGFPAKLFPPPQSTSLSHTPESYEFVPRSVENARRTKPPFFLLYIYPFFRNFSPQYRPRTRVNANPPLKISKLRGENKREMTGIVFQCVAVWLFLVSDPTCIEVDPMRVK